MTAPQILILGLGYVGTGVANRIVSRHPAWRVLGTVRGGQRQARAEVRIDLPSDLAQSPRYPLDPRVEVVEYALVDEYVATRRFTHVLCTIPPSVRGRDGRGEDGRRDSEVELDPLEVVRRSHAVHGTDAWVGYVSTTSVYGDHRGELVDESSLLVSNERNAARIEEERAWLEYMDVDVFRCGGIYGPYRNVLESLARRSTGRQRRAASTTDNLTSGSHRRDRALTMRCHVLDVCRVVENRMEQWEACRLGGTHYVHGVYNIVDDDPVGRRAVEAYSLQSSTLFADYCARFSHKPPMNRNIALDVGPREAEGKAAGDEHGTRPARRAEKRVSNRRMKDELGVQLCFPSVRDGLEALVYRGDTRPFDVEGLTSGKLEQPS